MAVFVLFPHSMRFMQHSSSLCKKKITIVNGMKKDNELKSTTEKLKPYYGLIFIAAAIALNIAANRFVTALNLPCISTASE